MRIAVLSDIHGNLTALEAVRKDLSSMSPDLVFHGGDLSDSGSRPAEIVDLIRDAGWQGVMGNTDEMLVNPGSLEGFAETSSAPDALWKMIRRIAESTREALGKERLAWLSELPRRMIHTELALVHASPDSCWRVPSATATDAELALVYGTLGRPTVVFGHTHLPFIRGLNGEMNLLINSGSVGLPYDGDVRASYLLLDSGAPKIRRVSYDVDREIRALSACGLPGAAWTAEMLRTGMPQMP